MPKMYHAQAWKSTVSNFADINIAKDFTHHLRNCIPLYNERFEEVYNFHEPGLAAVKKNGEAWHIGLSGNPAYNRRFHKTFGFYFNRAAVVLNSRWFHILPDGTDLYLSKYSWCGNFQDNRCVIRDDSAHYWHINMKGQPVYDNYWKYAGDYCKGIAVVQCENGLYSHIDELGKFVHNQWYLDLDVYHKGIARARDFEGWTHIDYSGNPINSRRFAMVEDFYNGQGRVERYDGGIEIIDRMGNTVIELLPDRKHMLINRDSFNYS